MFLEVEHPTLSAPVGALRHGVEASAGMQIHHVNGFKAKEVSPTSLKNKNKNVLNWYN